MTATHLAKGTNNTTDAMGAMISLMENDSQLCINEQIAENKKQLAEHKNMMVIECIQVSTGFNENDHYFLPTELWAARNTPKYQLVDWMHDREKILGCIIDCETKTFDGEDMPDDTEIDNEESEFDIYNTLVIWKKAFKKEADFIKAEAKKGNLYVSMECTFDDYDFVLQNLETKALSLIKRNKNTQFLADYLKIKKGKGVYQGHRVGIVFRDITFMGVGIVDDPANERSEITEVAANKQVKNVRFLENTAQYIKKNKTFGVKSSENDNILKTGENQMSKEKELEDAIASKDEMIAEKDSVISAKEQEMASIVSEKEEAVNKCVELEEKVVSLEAEAKSVRKYASKDDGTNQYSYITTDYDGNEVEVTETTVYSHESVTTVVQELVADLQARKQELEESALRIDELEKEKTEAIAKINEFVQDEVKRERKEAVAGVVVEISEEELFALSDEAFSTLLKYAPKVNADEDNAEAAASAMEPDGREEDEGSDEETAGLAEENTDKTEERLCAALAANIR